MLTRCSSRLTSRPPHPASFLHRLRHVKRVVCILSSDQSTQQPSNEKRGIIQLKNGKCSIKMAKPEEELEPLFDYSRVQPMMALHYTTVNRFSTLEICTHC